ncbi:MAG: pyruvate kinase [Rikenellaceae bacterium]
MLRKKKTKIVATISDFRCGEEYIKGLHEAGMDVVRVNSAHVSEESASKIVENVHKVNPAIPVMIDTKGPEIRVTSIAEEFDGAIEYKVGDRVSVRGTATAEPTRRDTIFMNVPSIVSDLSVGKHMLIADGALEIVVVEKSDEELTCEFTVGGVLKSRKSVNVPGVSIALPSITEKDRRFILWAIDNDVDFIAHSFVRSAADVKAVQDILDEHNSPIKIISKIENQEGISNIDEIIEASYGIMVARGDLGVELPAEKIPGIQRMIVERCTAAKRPVIIATQMLYSMVNSARPTRAEVSDVASAIYERVDAIMLSDETAMGSFPKESVATMARIAREIESDDEHFAPIVDIDMSSVNHEITAQLARSAVRACSNLNIRYVITDTQTGRTGRYLSAFRGRKIVMAVCYTLHAQRILALSYGVTAILRKEQNDKYRFVTDALDFMCDNVELDAKDNMVIVGGSFGPGRGGSYVEIANVAELREREKMIYPKL